MTAKINLQVFDGIVSTQWLADHLDDEIVVVDTRLGDSYTDEHITGAVHIEIKDITAIVNGVHGQLIDAERFASILGNVGIANDTPVVLYDDNWGVPSSRLAWALNRFGHHNVALLNGGWDRWLAENRPVSTDLPQVIPQSFTPQPNEQVLTTYDAIQSKLEQETTILIDTRTTTEFQQGHIPNAIQWDFMNAVPTDGDTFRSSDDVLTEFKSLGITRDKEIITYCRSGARAAHTYWFLKSLDFQNVKNYDGSWLEWSKLSSVINK